MNKAIVYLEDGTIFEGRSIGLEGTVSGELCFNTAMTGYQETFTDKSYIGQIMVMSNVHIGNYGVTIEDLEQESENITISGLVCSSFSNFFSRKGGNIISLMEYFKNNYKIAIDSVDTRALISYVREKGNMNAVLTTQIFDEEKLKKILSNTPNMEGLDLATDISIKASYFYGDKRSKYKIAIIDMGIKKNILRNFAKRGVYLQVYPYSTSFQEMEKWKPDGYFLSNGPGDPETLKYVQKLTKEIIDSNKPLFGICLGHQIIAIANGIRTYKMKTGHRGINNPVKNIITGRGEITSQNHGFAINREDLENNKDFELTHIHINDGTVSGMRMKNKKCISVQYHPEAGPGTSDSEYLFDEFIKMLG